MEHHAKLWRKSLPELIEAEKLLEKIKGVGTTKLEGEVHYGLYKFPIYSYQFGSQSPDAPCLAFVGGVHGLERIGTNVCLAYLNTVCELARWDRVTQEMLERCRLVFLPLINPVGMFLETRANGRGVDLMRNAPVDAEERLTVPLVGGHRISHKLPWYRGELGQPMETEAQILVKFIERELFHSPFSISLDLHSGFGAVDRIWFPYAKSKKPFENISEVYALKNCLDKVYPHHIYCVEPQSLQYMTHGDLWDYLYLRYRERQSAGVFLPLCLEMGSWIWVKKNPRQLFSLLGMFNPILPHRMRRTMRRHSFLMDFLLRATASYKNWIAVPNADQAALDLWYRKRNARESA